jgi:GlpG protein
VEKSSPITAYLILFCFLLFTSDFLTEPNVTEIVKNLPATPQVSSAIKKTALYDYPKAYELEDKLIKIYGLDKLSQPEELPLPGKQLLQTFYKTPYWKGAYMQFFGKAKNKSGASLPPMFEKLSEGQFWRLISPSFMHYDLLHILFNMLWLFVLGKQLEVRLKAGKYLFLMALLAIFSNTCQYLMSGVDFLGFSGIICGFLTFIWMRQRVAPWEGYPLERTTFNFMMIFIGAMALIQLTSFYLELNHDLSISPGIANTAHLSGALFGAFLARWPVFGWKI